MTIVRGYIVPSIQPRTGSTNLPLISTPSLPPAEVGAAYTFQMAAVNGVPPYTWSITASSPDTTMAITPAGLIQWTPQASAFPQETVNIRVTDSVAAPTAPTQFSLTVFPQLLITTTSLPSGQANTAYSATLTATGGSPPYKWSITGQDGAGFPALNTATGALSGTPTAGENLTITAKVTDSLNASVSQGFPLFIQGVVGTNQPPQRIFVGNVDDVTAVLQLWPPTTGDADGGYNFYRKDPANNIVKLNGNTPVQLVSPGTFRPVPQITFVDTVTTGILPATNYTYWGTAISGGVESAPGPTIAVTTLAPGPGSTLPKAPIAPETYITVPPTSYSNFYNNTNTTPISTLAGLQAALSGAQPGQVVVLQAGVTIASNAAPAFNMTCSGTASQPIIFTTTEDPVFKSGGKLVPYAPFAGNIYFTSITLSSMPAAGALTASLAPNQAGITDASGNFIGRGGYFDVVFDTTAPPSMEKRLCHFVPGSSTIAWEAGFMNGGPLIGNVTSTTISAQLGNYVTWDDRNTSLSVWQFPVPAASQTGLVITGDYVYLIGIAVVPVPNVPANRIGNLGIQISATCDHVTLDRCLVGNDTGLSTWSPVAQGIQNDGTNTVIHQCNILGMAIGMPTFLGANTAQEAHGLYVHGGGPLVLENSFVEAMSENLFMGGGSYVPESGVPNNLVVRGNYIEKNGAWNQTEFGVYVKNLSETKTSDTVEYYGNIFFGSWEAFGTAGQKGMGIAGGTIDQVASSPQRNLLGPLTWSNGVVQGEGQFWGSGLAVNSLVTTTISGVTPTVYNGTFLLTITAIAADGSRSFQYNLPNGGVNPGNGNTSAAKINTTTLMCAPWARVVDWNVHDNQIYGVAAATNPHNDEGQQSTGHVARFRFANNFCYMNPLGSGVVKGAITLTAPPTSTGATIQSITWPNGTVTTNWPYPGNANGSTIVLSTGQTITISTLPPSGTVITWASTTITGTPTTAATILAHTAQSNIRTVIIGCPAPDITIDHNTTIAIANKTGYLNTGASAFTCAIQVLTNGVAPNTALARRQTYTNNVFDGTSGFNAATQAGTGINGDGPTVVTQCCPAVVWNDNALITDARAGYPTTTFNPVAYTNLFGGTFAGNTVFPTSPVLLNVNQAPYNASSTTGGPIGSNFQTLQFPLLGAVLVGGDIDFTNVANIANVDVALFTCYPGYNVGGKTFPQQVTSCLAKNPALKIFPQTNIMEVSGGQMVSTDAHFAKYQKDNANQWWLRTTYPGSGSNPTSGNVGDTDVVISQASAASVNICTTNTTSATDSFAPAGSTYTQWQAAWNVSFMTAIAPGVAGINTDNWFPNPGGNPGKSGDYLQNGTTQTPSAAQQTWRNAYVDWAAKLRTAMGPGYMVFGNVADWGKFPITGYNQLINGGIMEGCISSGFAYENTSWLTLMNYYKTVMQALAPFNGQGPWPIFNQQSASSSSSLGSFAAFRYGFCSCLLDNAYYANVSTYNSIPFFDEFNFNLGVPIAGPNNPTNGTYSNGGLTVWQNGVWRRDFANGIVLVNPRGNGVKTVTLETTYWHLRGTQDPAINNAAAITSITMGDAATAGVGGSGIVLSRTAT